MIRALQRLIFAGAAFALPLSASAHGSEFLVAKALVQNDGRVLLEVTADYGDNPMIANEAEAATVVQHVLRIANGAGKLAVPRLERRTQPDPDSPLPPDPMMVGKPHQLLAAVWQIAPVSEALRFEVPEDAGQSVILWTKNLLHPEEKTHWVMLVPGEQSPPIKIPKPIRKWVLGLGAVLLAVGIFVTWRLVPRRAGHMAWIPSW